MSTSSAQSTHPGHNGGHNGDRFTEQRLSQVAAWREQTRVVIQPIAAPSVLGLFGFAVATFIVTANLVGWFGNATTPTVIWPYAVATGGIAQGVAALWSYRARDTLASAVHGIWAAFWLAYGILWAFTVAHALPMPGAHAVSVGMNYWFYTLGAVTLVCALAAMGESVALTILLLLLGCGAGLLGIAMTVGGTTWYDIGAYVTMASSVVALYTGGAMLMATTWGRTVLPMGKVGRHQANAPGEQPVYPIEFAAGEPGVRQGQ